MTKKTTTKKNNPFTKLDKLIRQNQNVDFRTANFLNAKTVEALNWKGIKTEDQDQVLQQVKAYQRLVRLLAEDNPKIIMELLKRNLHSAVQIAAIPKSRFMKEFREVFKDEALMEQVYARALAIRSQVLLKYMNIVQNKQLHTKTLKAVS